MQVVALYIFLGVWLLVFWFGSIALEATGLQRTKARFQALSALAGTGFTTRESELIVNHPKRRRITSWLIFLGSLGIVSFIVLVVLFVRAGLTAPSPVHLGILLGIITLIVLLIKFRAIDKVTDAILRRRYKQGSQPVMATEELLYQIGDYAVAHIAVRGKERVRGIRLMDSGLLQQGVNVLAIERGRQFIHFPKPQEMVLAGDYLLCYGKVEAITGVAP